MIFFLSEINFRSSLLRLQWRNRLAHGTYRQYRDMPGLWVRASPGASIFFIFLVHDIQPFFCLESYCQVSLAEWSKAPDLSSGSREGAWVRTPQLTNEFLVWNTPINKILSRISDNLGWQRNSYYWLDGLGVWFALRVREVPGSIPGQAHLILSSCGYFPQVLKNFFKCQEKKEWRGGGSNPRPSKCESDALPLSYIPI